MMRKGKLVSQKKDGQGQNLGGFTLIDVLVGTFLVLVIFSGIFGAFQLGMKVVARSRAEITALALVNQKMEQVRNLAYDDIGTIGGIVPGQIPKTENFLRNYVNYTIETTVIYIDDPFDGLVPSDANSADYKKVRVRCYWEGRVSGEMSLTTNVAPKGVETTMGGGTLSISVFDAQGIQIPQAHIRIVNNEVDPPIDDSYITDTDIELILAGTPISFENYQITVTKSGDPGYSSSRTYGSDEIANPSKPHISIYDGKLTETGFSIDVLSSFLIQTTGAQAQGYPPIKDVIFTLTGAKIIGTDTDGNSVPKHFESCISGGAGKVDISNLEWDSYTFAVDKSLTGLDLIGFESPYTSEISQPIDILPQSEVSVRLILSSENTLLLTVNNGLQEPIFGVQARLYNLDLGYDNLLPSGEDGKVFFIPLEEAVYSLEIAAQGYLPYSGAVSVSGDTTAIIELEQ